jgi:hypothetical protein
MNSIKPKILTLTLDITKLNIFMDLEDYVEENFRYYLQDIIDDDVDYDNLTRFLDEGDLSSNLLPVWPSSILTEELREKLIETVYAMLDGTKKKSSTAVDIIEVLDSAVYDNIYENEEFQDILQKAYDELVKPYIELAKSYSPSVEKVAETKQLKKLAKELGYTLIKKSYK